MTTTTRTTTKSSKLFGGEGGKPFVIGKFLSSNDDNVDAAGVNDKENDAGNANEDTVCYDISSITIHWDSMVDGITMEYTNGTKFHCGYVGGGGGGTTSSGELLDASSKHHDHHHHKKHSKSKSSTLTLSSDEYIRDGIIRVTNESVMCIKLSTNKGNVLGPCGDPDGTFLRRGKDNGMNAPNGYKLVGLTGYCNEDIIHGLSFVWGRVDVNDEDDVSEEEEGGEEEEVVVVGKEDAADTAALGIAAVVSEEEEDEGDKEDGDEEEEVSAAAAVAAAEVAAEEVAQEVEDEATTRRDVPQDRLSSSSDDNKDKEDEEFERCAEDDVVVTNTRSTVKDEEGLENTRETLEARTTLIAIVSAWDIPHGDVSGTSDPYVVVTRVANPSNTEEAKDDDKDVVIHKTDYISKSTNPIWTVDKQSLFVLHSSAEDVYNTLGEDIDGTKEPYYKFEVHDYDVGLLKDVKLCSVIVPLRDLLRGNGRRMEYNLIEAEKKQKKKKKSSTSSGAGSRFGARFKSAGTLVLRFRDASSDDLKMIEKLNTNKKDYFPIKGLCDGDDDDDDDDFTTTKDGVIVDESGFIPPSLGEEMDLKNEEQETKKKKSKFGFFGKLTKRSKKKDEETGETKITIKPGPDPNRVNETEWMTKEEIELEVLKPSTNWIDAGSSISGDNNLGTIQLEILGCDGLPNYDGGITGKTDAFVCIVHEDVVICTSVIADCLSPRWMPWTKRAVSLRRLHPCSKIYLGVFDYDDKGMGDDHDYIGRVAVDVSNLKLGMDYTLYYNLYPSAKLGLRDVEADAKGSIIVRIRIDPPSQPPPASLSKPATAVPKLTEGAKGDGVASPSTSVTMLDGTIRPGFNSTSANTQRNICLSSLTPPPQFYIQTLRRKDLRAARYTIHGNVDVNTFALSTLTSYVSELLTYQDLWFLVKDGFWSVVLWRGHYKIMIPLPKFLNGVHLPEIFSKRLEGILTKDVDDYDDDAKEKDKESDDEEDEDDEEDAFAEIPWKLVIYLPFHSMVAFTLSLAVVEYPRFFPSFVLGFVAWMLLAIMENRRNDPSPWKRCKSYTEIIVSALFGTSCCESAAPVVVESSEKKKKKKKKDSATEKLRLTPEQKAATIKPFQNAQASKELNEEWNKRVELSKRRALERARVREEMLREEMIALNATKVTTESCSAAEGGIALSPLEPFLKPLQLLLCQVCEILRVVRSIITWDECYLTFWLVTFCFVGSVFFAFVPLGSIIQWIARIVVWLGLGPWMILVDCLYLRRFRFRRAKDVEEEESIEGGGGKDDTNISNNNTNQQMRVTRRVKNARVVREDVVQMKDWRTLFFGSYGIAIPLYNVDRHVDVPLPPSSAVPHFVSNEEKVDQVGNANANVRVLGQYMTGHLIPHRVGDENKQEERKLQQQQQQTQTRGGIGGADIGGGKMNSNVNAMTIAIADILKKGTDQARALKEKYMPPSSATTAAGGMDSGAEKVNMEEKKEKKNQ